MKEWAARYLTISPETARKPSILVLLCALLFSFWLVDFWKPYNSNKGGHNFYWDVFGYYSYLPAYFCNNGKLEFKNDLSDHNPPGPLGTHVPKYTYGLSVMYSPFFALSYKIAWNQKSPLDGFSQPFVTCIHWAGIFYVLLGLVFLRKFLLRFFNEPVTAIVLGSCLFGTMLFNYTFVQSELTHGYLFCLFCIFLYLTERWHCQPTYGKTIWVGLVTGLIVLIRPTEVFIFLFFIFWDVRSFGDLKKKFFFLSGNYRHMILIFVIACLWWIPQLLFYKQHTGSYFYFSYMRERFFWNDPQVINVLFSYRKGWITYTPLVALAFVGFFFIPKRVPFTGWTCFLILASVLYVLSCWWDWNFGGCFGARSFCQHIAILSVPLASVLEYLLYSEKRFPLKGVYALMSIVFVCSCISLNMGMTYQYEKNKKIHPWATSKKIYWKVLRTYQFTDAYNYEWYSLLNEPDFVKYSDGSDRDQ
jgi:hypothetical protein